MPAHSLLEELKQPKVVQWSVGYIAAAWIVAVLVATGRCALYYHESR